MGDNLTRRRYRSPNLDAVASKVVPRRQVGATVRARIPNGRAAALVSSGVVHVQDDQMVGGFGHLNAKRSNL